MPHEMIEERLAQYKLVDAEQEENALKEILQDISLYALSTTDFFQKALFQGGTALRILYDLPRFSEDLDFMLKKPDKHFRWEKYIDKIKKILTLYDIEPDITDRSKTDANVQKLFLKDNSIGKILQLKFQHHAHKKLFIKFEIDINPPLGATEAMRYLTFPIDYAIATQDLPSNFAGKCHALLCRQYVKGRDWFDLAWYISKKTEINFSFLRNAMIQTRPWEKQRIRFDKSWLIEQLKIKIVQLNWEKIINDVLPFVARSHVASLNVWSKDFFLNKIAQLNDYLPDNNKIK